MTEQEFVPKYFVMDPDTHIILSNGRKLRNGMVVLIEDPDKRERPDAEELRDWEKDRLLVNNRWATVTEVSTDDHTVRFIALYEDGTRRQRALGIHLAWLVKRDSLETAQSIFDEAGKLFGKMRLSVYDQILEGMQSVAPRSYTGSVNRRADELAHKIMWIFEDAGTAMYAIVEQNTKGDSE